MPAPYPIELRERAVGAYESGRASYAVVAERFSVAIRALERRKAAHAGRRRVKRRHCRAWFEHAG
jgi:transposase-like protein